MKKLIFILNDLGQVGKTTCTQVLHEYLERKGFNHLMVATDPDAGDALPDSQVIDIGDGLNTSDIIEMLDRGGIVLMDVATDCAGALADFCAEEEIGTLLAELEAELTIVLPLNRELEAFEPLIDVVETIADDADYVVVHTPTKTELQGDFENSELARALEHLGAIEVEMPRIEPGILNELENERGLPLAAALGDRKQLPRYLRDAIHAWELEFCSDLAEANDFILPGNGSATSSPYRKAKTTRKKAHSQIGLAS